MIIWGKAGIRLDPLLQSMLTFDQKCFPAVAGLELRQPQNVVTVLRPDDAGEDAFLSQMGGLEVHPEGERMRSA
jgi:hypothetical protein